MRRSFSFFHHSLYKSIHSKAIAEIGKSNMLSAILQNRSENRDSGQTQTRVATFWSRSHAGVFRDLAFSSIPTSLKLRARQIMFSPINR